jgi:hypothetical protein
VTFTQTTFEPAIVKFRAAILGQNFDDANRQLSSVSGLVAQAWPLLSGPEKDHVHAEFMSILHWARITVKMAREEMAGEMRRVEGAKIYQMPSPAARVNLHG